MTFFNMPGAVFVGCLGVVANVCHAEATSSVNLSGDESLFLQAIPSVFGASKYEQKVNEAPSSVTIITAEDIHRYGYTTLAEILRGVRGFYTTYDRNYSYLGVRGYGRPTDYNSRVLFLLDGHRLNENIYDGADIGTEFILNVDLIDRIEVIRGPGSSLYGTNALFAVINIISKRGRDINGTELSGGVMSYNTTEGRVSYGSRLKGGSEVLVSAASYQSRGQDLYFPEFNTPATNNGIAQGVDHDKAKRLLAKLTDGNFSLETAYVNREKQIPTGAFEATFNNPNTATKDERAFLSLKYQNELSTESSLMARIAYDYYTYEGIYANGIAGQLTRDDGDWRAWLTEVQLTHVLATHKIVAGVDYQRNLQQDQENYEVSTSAVYVNDRRSSERWSLFAQDEYRLNETTLINIGIRHDDYSVSGGSTNPRLALINNFDKQSTLKLMYGQAFRVPNPYELYFTPSPWLKPEKIKTYEVVLERIFKDNQRGTMSLYTYKVNSLIYQQADYTYLNIGNAKTEGVELGYEGHIFGNVDFRSSLTYQQAKNTDTGEDLTNSPNALAKLHVSTPIGNENRIIGAEALYMDRRKTIGGGYLAGVTLFNLTLWQRNIIKGLSVSASIYNLTDKNYADTAGEEHRNNAALLTPMESITQDGRNFRVKATYEF